MTDRQVPAVRQTFNRALGWVGVAAGVLLAGAGSLGRGGAGPALVGMALACLSYCVMARPFIRFTATDVVVSNVLREVVIPWRGVSHATSRGSLAVHDVAGARTTVWAIGSQKARSTSAADADEHVGPLHWRPDPATLAVGSTSSQALREAIDAECIDNPPAASSGRVVRWLPLPCLLMVVALACLVVAVVR